MAVILSAAVTVFFGDRLTNGADVLSFIATIFSILAGVLIAVISILGDPSMLLDQSWRHSYLSATETQRKIHRQTDVFIVYVVLLISLFVFMLADPKATSFWYIQHATFFLTVLAFIASLTLPYSLRSIQKTRLDKAIEQIRGK
ncbi:hypothetical protein JQ506_22985 [Shinella sp. PSBB067]|uniref:hypothetical protein n=1 Tax=Shinella sp. PSBB067 TaxID=2715959 RepID=UPI00193B6557|nr:hypothetical protein [Shinella sp. PSBB067]QRI63627.1 hypothetical protein JQ506_22985 [Shinella sp. PSBB067]